MSTVVTSCLQEAILAMGIIIMMLKENLYSLVQVIKIPLIMLTFYQILKQHHQIALDKIFLSLIRNHIQIHLYGLSKLYQLVQIIVGTLA